MIAPDLFAQAEKRGAYRRLQDARLALGFARDAFEGFPGDDTREGVIEAEVEFEDSRAVAQEWGVAA